MSENEPMDDNNISEAPSEDIESADGTEEYKGSVGWGIGQILLWHLVQIPVGAVTFFFGLILISVSQLVYVIPAIIIARRKGEEKTVKGIIIAASLTALLNIACTGYFFYSFGML